MAISGCFGDRRPALLSGWICRGGLFSITGQTSSTYRGSAAFNAFANPRKGLGGVEAKKRRRTARYKQASPRKDESGVL
jgi:hypothetical protein